MILQDNTVYKLKELAEFFNVTPHTMSCSREKYLNNLSLYCEFEDLGKKGIHVTKVKINEFAGKTRAIVERDFMEAWHTNLNMIKNAAHYIYDKNKDVLTVSYTTLYNVTCMIKREWFGVPKKCDGSKSYCSWVSAIVNLDGSCRYLTDEEKQLRRKIYKKIDAETPDIELEDLDELNGLKRYSVPSGEMTEAEFAELAMKTRQQMVWEETNDEFYRQTGLRIDIKLEVVQSAFWRAAGLEKTYAKLVSILPVLLWEKVFSSILSGGLFLMPKNRYAGLL